MWRSRRIRSRLLEAGRLPAQGTARAQPKGSFVPRSPLKTQVTEAALRARYCLAPLELHCSRSKGGRGYSKLQRISSSH